MRVALVEDHPTVRASLSMLLRRAGAEIVGDAGDAEAGAKLLRDTHPDVALVDIALRKGDGLQLAEELSRLEPGIGIVLYTGVEKLPVLARALESGARGIALKAGEPAELIEAMRVVAGGGHYVDPRITKLLARGRRPRGDRRLSAREREVVQLLAEGLSGAEIADRLVLSPETIRTHVRNAKDRCKARTRAHLIALALRDDQILPPRRWRAVE